MNLYHGAPTVFIKDFRGNHDCLEMTGPKFQNNREMFKAGPFR